VKQKFSSSELLTAYKMVRVRELKGRRDFVNDMMSVVARAFSKGRLPDTQLDHEIKEEFGMTETRLKIRGRKVATRTHADGSKDLVIGDDAVRKVTDAEAQETLAALRKMEHINPKWLQPKGGKK